MAHADTDTEYLIEAHTVELLEVHRTQTIYIDAATSNEALDHATRALKDGHNSKTTDTLNKGLAQHIVNALNDDPALNPLSAGSWVRVRPHTTQVTSQRIIAYDSDPDPLES